MAQGTREIREEIEGTRMRVGEEVEALSYKTDVGARLDDYVDEKKEAVVSKVSDAKNAVTGAVGSMVPSGEEMKRRGQGIGHVLKRNPLGLVVGSAALGFVAGLVIPSTSVEDENLGDMASKMKDTVRETGVDRSHHRKLQQVLWPALHIGTSIEQYRGPLPRRYRGRQRGTIHAGHHSKRRVRREHCGTRVSGAHERGGFPRRHEVSRDSHR